MSLVSRWNPYGPYRKILFIGLAPLVCWCSVAAAAFGVAGAMASSLFTLVIGLLVLPYGPLVAWLWSGLATRRFARWRAAFALLVPLWLGLRLSQYWALSLPSERLSMHRLFELGGGIVPGLQALLQLQPQAISTSMLLGACLALLPLAVILGLAKLFDSPLASSLTVPPAPIRLPGLLVIALLWLGSIAGLSLAVAAVDDFKAEVAERARQRDFEREYLAGQTGNSFVVAFCHGRLGEARSLLMQRPQWGDAAALTHLGRHCLAPADGRSGFDPARLDLLVEALAAEERRAGSMDSADCPALRTALVRRLGSWDPMGTFRRFHRYDLSLRCRDRQEDPPAPLWWVPFSSNVAYSGAPLMPSAADFAEFETLGIDLRETDALGHTFLTAGLAHQLDGQALRDLLDRGLPSALRQGPPVSPAVPDLAVELMYRRFGWQQAKTTPADLAVMLERVGEPTAAQLAQARLDVSGLRNLGLDRERATALADYLAEHGIHLAER